MLQICTFNVISELCLSREEEKKKKAVNPGQVVMTTWPTGNVMVSDPFL